MKKILAVDNDRIFLKLLANLLEGEGHRVVTAGGGLTALDVLTTFTPDVIFLDLVMPSIDGKTLCRMIREKKELEDVPIVILSGVSIEDLEDVSRLDVNACIAKGKFSETAPHILSVVNDAHLATARFKPSETLGMAEGYPRGITKELLHIKKHFEVVLEKMVEGIVEINPGGRIVYANHAACTLFGKSEKALLGALAADLFNDDGKRYLADRSQPQAPGIAQRTDWIRLPLNDNWITLNALPVVEDGSPPSSILIVHDITEQKRAEDTLHNAHEDLKAKVDDLVRLQGQLVRSERLAAAGQLAASVAHEINSPLQAITVLLSKMAGEHAEDQTLAKDVDLLKTAVGNITRTVRYLIDLARPVESVKQETDANQVIRETVGLTRSHLTRRKIDIELHLSQTLPRIRACPRELSHLLLNLINNAADAMDPNTSSGNQGGPDPQPVRKLSISSRAENGTVVIVVADTGQGIPEEDLQRVFDPFYTRKKKMGLGVGLSNCHTIVSNHDGTITAGHSPSGGAEMTIRLPMENISDTGESSHEGL